MRSRAIRRYGRPINPLHAILIAAPLPLFLGAVLSNWAYASTYEIQWTNFASWLVAGGLVFAGFALVWSIVDLFAAGRGVWGWAYAGLTLAMFGVGFVTALVQAKDAWAAMPAALVLSIVIFLLAAAANWAAHAGRTGGDGA